MASSSRPPAAPPLTGVNLDAVAVRWRLLGCILALANGVGAEEGAAPLSEAELEEHAESLLAACTMKQHAAFVLQNGCGAACGAALRRASGDRLKELLLGTLVSLWGEHVSVRGPLADAALARTVIDTLCSTDHPGALRECSRVLGLALKCDEWADAVLLNGVGLARLVALAERSPHPGLVGSVCDALATLAWCHDEKPGSLDWLLVLRAAIAVLLTHAQAPPGPEADFALCYALDLVKAVTEANEDDPTVEMALAVLARDGSFHMALLPLIDRYAPPADAVAAAAEAAAAAGDRKGKRKAVDAPPSALGVPDEEEEEFDVRAPPDLAVSAMSAVATRLQRAMHFAPPLPPGHTDALTALLGPLRDGAAGTLDTLAVMQATCQHEGTLASVGDLLESIYPERRARAPSRAGSPIRLPGGSLLAAALPPMEISADAIVMLAGMGFDPSAAEGALRRAHGDVSRAAEFLLS
jgi:hypothetical protein